MHQRTFGKDGSGSDLSVHAKRPRRLGLEIALLAIVSLVVYRQASGQQTQDSYKFGRDAQQGKAINPATLNLQGKKSRNCISGNLPCEWTGGMQQLPHLPVV
jgi:hypothetical protein